MHALSKPKTIESIWCVRKDFTQMKKRKCILIALLVMLSLILPGAAAYADEGAVWTYDENNLYVSFSGDLSGDVVIPDEVDGYAPNALKYGTFSGQNAVTSITLPSDMYVLQDGAISDMEGLTSVTLNEGLEYIGASNFLNCPALTEITVPASVRMVDGAFGSSLTQITFLGECPMFLNENFCFFMMPDEYTIYVPDDRLDEYTQALAACDVSPDHIQPSGQNAVPVEQPDMSEWFDVDEETGTIIAYKAFHAYVEIPAVINGVAITSIGEGALSGDYSIYGITFPEGLEEIGASAFYAASNITYISFPSTLRTIGDEAFFNAQASVIDWSEGLEQIGARAFMYDYEKTIELPSTVRTIGESAFESGHCMELHLSGDIEHIGARAFASTQLNYIVLDTYDVIDIASDAFTDTYVADVDLPWDSTIETRDAYTALLSDQCPDATVWINNPASAGVADYPEDGTYTLMDSVWTSYTGDDNCLTIWTSSNGVNITTLGEGLFKGNADIRAFYPHHCGWFTTIGDEAFADSGLEFIEMFPSITTIGSGAFRNCTNLTALTLPESLESIAADALDGCTSLTELIVLCDPAILPEGLLDSCTSLTEIYAAEDATDEQVETLSNIAGYPWYNPVTRIGEESAFEAMPYNPTSGDDFWYDETYSRIDQYNGYELNLVLPRDIDGIALTALGNSMMERAKADDDGNIELPVRSLVIPENYTTAYAYAFDGCESLETVICYAPLEQIPDAMFNNCKNLRNVVFVNGVRSIGQYVFSGCESLETVYIGDKVIDISEYAFLNDGGETAFDGDKCITDPAQMPDLDALLSEVKSDAMQAPDDDQTSNAVLTAQPVGEEGMAYVGKWNCVSMVFDGESMSPADFGMTMTVVLNEDGTMLTYYNDESEESVWGIADGIAYIEDMPVYVDDQGRLIVEEEGEKLIFEPYDGEVPVPTEAATAVEQPATVNADAEAFVGNWNCETIVIEGVNVAMSDLDMTLILTLSEDGSAVIYSDEELNYGTWSALDGVVDIADMTGTMNADGNLVIDDEDSQMIFVPYDGEMPVVDDAVDVTQPTETAEPVETAEPTETPEPAESANIASDYVGTWVCVIMKAGGAEYNLGELGVDMHLTVYEDGTAELYDCGEVETSELDVIDGVMYIEGMAFALDDEGNLILSEGDNALTFVRGEPDDIIGSTEESRLNVKYVCTGATVNDFEMDAASLGAEYALTFYEDGSLEMILAGTTLTDLTWTHEVTLEETGAELNKFVIDYYGMNLDATWTDTGFDLNYFNSMIMHFAKEGEEGVDKLII